MLIDPQGFVTFIVAGGRSNSKPSPAEVLRQAHLATEARSGVHANGCWNCGGDHLTGTCKAIPPENYLTAATVIESAAGDKGRLAHYAPLIADLRSRLHNARCAQRAAQALDELDARLL